MRKQVLILIFIIFLQVSLVQGVAIGVNKATLDFKNVLKGGYAEETVIISTDTDDEIGIERRVTGDIADWIRFEPEEIRFSSTNPGSQRIIVEPPEDTANGVYSGEVTLITTPLIQTTTGRLGTAIRTSFLIRVTVEVTGDQIVACTAGGFGIADAEITFPLVFRSRVNNDGNVRIQPNFQIDVWDQIQTNLLGTYEFTDEVEILPTTTANIAEDIEVNLDTGQYWAEVSAPLCGGSDLLTFSIVEKGEIVDQGELIRIKNSLWVEVGDIVPIEFVFKNTGSRVESAKAKGTIKLANQIIKVIDTDAVNVDPGETVTLESFFNPKLPGQYLIDGRVLYNNKLTFWKSSVLNALPSEEFEKRVRQTQIKEALSTAGLLAIVIIILLLLIKIKKKKKKKVKFNF